MSKILCYIYDGMADFEQQEYEQLGRIKKS